MDEIRIYTAESGISSPARMLKDIFRGFLAGKFLGYQLFIRDLRASVRQSFLGFFWHFIPAIASAVIWIILNRQHVISVQNVPMGYPAFVITGTILWSIFVESVNKPLARFNAAKPVMTKLNFPREAVLLAAVYDIIFSIIIRLLILLPCLMFFGYMPSLAWLPAIAAIVPLAIMGIAFGVLLVPLGMLYTDVTRGIGLVFQFLMYLSPVIFPFQTTGFMGLIHKINPVSPFLELIRSNFGHYGFDQYISLAIWAGITLIILSIGLITLRLSLSAILERSGA